MEQTVEKLIGFELENGVGYITLNRPNARNSINEAMFESLLAVLQRCETLDSLKVLVLRGEGDVFCGGGDIQFFRQLLTATPASRQQQLAGYIHSAHQVIAALMAISCPVVAAIQGAAAGYGMSLACASDIIIAEQGCQFIPAYTALGTTPDGGLTYLLPALIGEKRALDVLWFNRAVKAEEALDWGLVNRVCAPGMLAQTVEEFTATLSQGARQAQRNLKKLVTERSRSQLSQQMDQELNSFLKCAATDDFIEGVQAFLERRPSQFKGC
ncbi:enoyl-CoA hydratase-related protein [Amphritea sp. 2_MG-2023]|uniref:enoyl-CoA hydratase/isomerase family protein n=1 Tax=Amphritea TaxID=515417 RepID=UPI001C07B4B9|nr:MULTISPECIES: enoyl-CoA hydratase-related protein [Amphritea]MBU2964151.1 enoyl-CoA hydratase/isomerase family protein [Amphritea atlantica]MDO6418550.1 enoyl-CoA hydratase-related protein [Amphritea sp. 2_MG-2023]MDX2424007.1 enoyl-CoA hydratase-related protein [Amphritea sp.]